jgi:hypothetical protein
MKPVEQTVPVRTEEAAGNCFAACLASIMEVGIDDVPNLGADELQSAYMERVQFWLAQRGLCAIQTLHRWTTTGCSIPFPGHAILVVGSPRIQGGKHAVVWSGGKMVWDPHPQRDMGVGEAQEIIFLVPICPEDHKRRLG